MARRTRLLAAFGVFAVAVATGMNPLLLLGQNAAAQARMYPTWEPDPTYGKLPNDWTFGNVSKVVTDKQDNLWVIHRPHTVPAGLKAAPSVVVFDKDGKFLRAWGGRGSGYDWPNAEHNIFVDHNNFVWISGSSPSGQSQKPRESDDMLLKFTAEGRFVKQIGGRSSNLGSRDPNNVNKPGDIFVYAPTNEVFLADGYGNRRVIVFDAETMAYKRMWGAFGNMPEDRPGLDGGRGPNGGLLPAVPVAPPTPRPAGTPAPPPTPPAVPAPPPPPLDTDGPGSMLFLYPVHAIAVSNDNVVYASDRSSRRIQVFDLMGTYSRQVFVNRAGPSGGSVSGFAFSPDPQQEFLYATDYGNSHIVIMDRKSLDILYQFGTRGTAPGQFQGVHMIATDSKHNLYAAEVAPGARLQKFTFKGMSATLPPNALTAAQLAPKQ